MLAHVVEHQQCRPAESNFGPERTRLRPSRGLLLLRSRPPKEAERALARGCGAKCGGLGYVEHACKTYPK